MNDYAEIANLIADYSRIYDSGDFTAYAALFRHGRIGGPTGDFDSVEQIADYHRGNCILYGGLPNTRHVVTNLKIEVEEGARVASGECYVIIYQAAPGFPLQPIFVGSYLDHFHKIEGRWWFKTRRCEAHLVGDLSKHARGYLPPTHLAAPLPVADMPA